MVEQTTTHRAIAFVDLRGFSEYTMRHGDGAAARLHRHLAETIRTEAAAADVHVVKLLGDGAMLAADDADRLARLAGKLMAAVDAACPLRLRAGLAHGPVVPLEDGDYIGATVNAAARACSAARVGELKIADRLKPLVSSRDRVIASLVARPT